MKNEDFEISANTYVLKNNSNDNTGKSILGNDCKYTIPIYQRSYSWHKEQVVRIIRDIFESFRGVEGDKKSEPMFIGTMQLKPENEEINIIDGQQRLTTLLILLKVLQLRNTENQELNNIEFEWLETRVSGGEQQEYLDGLKTISIEKLNELTEEANKDRKKDIENINHYIKNAIIINQELSKQKELDEKRIEELQKESKNKTLQEFSIDNFTEYLFTQVHFVCIETRAGLSKTLKIFDAINTTGLDLNTGDIFKIRMYEYLKNKNSSNGEDNKIFQNINNLYTKIDKCNKEYKKEVSNIQEILRIYQFYLIGKYDLPVVLYSFATDTFYERLFETIFKINTQWPNFQTIVKQEDKLELNLEIIDKLIEARFKRHKLWLEMNAEDKMYQYLWSWSRYDNRKILMDIYLYKFKENGFKEFVQCLVRTFLQYSLCYDRSIYMINRYFTNDIIKEILANSTNTLTFKQLNDSEKEFLSTRLRGEIFHLTTAKNILCRLSAALEVLENKPNIKEVEYIFTEKMDIEHIQSQTDETEKAVPEEWKEDINTLGNLVLLERKINISIQNETDRKIGKKGKLGYPSSELTIVHDKLLNLVKENDNWNWTPEKAKAKKVDEITKIENFLYPNNYNL